MNIEKRISDIKNNFLSKGNLEKEIKNNIYFQLKNTMIIPTQEEVERINKYIKDEVKKMFENVDGITYSPIISFIKNDFEKVIIDFKRFKVKDIFDLNDNQKININSSKLELEKYCADKILVNINGKDSYEFMYVLTKNNELYISKNIHAKHSNMASYNNVITAGYVYISKDLNEIVCINNKSGHYKPNVQSCLKTLNELIKKFNISEIIITNENNVKIDNDIVQKSILSAKINKIRYQENTTRNTPKC